ncbi:MAG: alpha-keto acid decarboxylase family protein [Methanotrichaceae archaeon]|nr:alpha-keto acid decarboxylase family protein [Methanotrichaceae archaeon]
MGTLTVGDYIIRKLMDLKVEHVFGIPGDYVLGFYKMLDDSPLMLVNTSDEQGAAFAADAYARMRGLGAICITYCVGGLKVINAVAQAYAEKSPLVVISGSPGVEERQRNPMLHHKVKEFDTQLRVFQEITVASAVLSDPHLVCQEVNRVIEAAMRFKRPVYLEIPRDMVSVPLDEQHCTNSVAMEPDEGAMIEALDEVARLIDRASQPVILAGIEVHRFGLREEVTRLAERLGIPMASTVLSRSVIEEDHPLSLGVYEGAVGREEVGDYIDSSDCLVLLGTFFSDLNMGMFAAKIDQERSIYVTSEAMYIHHHRYDGVDLGEFIRRLASRATPRTWPEIPRPIPQERFHPLPDREITVARLFQAINSFLRPGSIVVTDVGDCLFGSLDLRLPHQTTLLAPAYYASLGFGVPGSIGAELAVPGRRPLVLVGDGGFQMTGMELSTAARYGLRPVVVLFNNGGYGTERPLLDGAFNDLHNWRYSIIPQVLGGGEGVEVRTEGELEAALAKAGSDERGYLLIEVHLDKDDMSPALNRLTQRLAAKVKA